MLRRSILAAGLAAPALAQRVPDPENTLLMQLKDGLVTIQMRPDLAPQHVARIKVLVRRSFYNNIVFHRVIEGFMAQGGDPTGTGTGGSDLPNLPAEFSPPNVARFTRGTCGMARSGAPNSANSQFFIMFAPNSGLDGQYTIWGQVVSGMEAVERIKRGDAARNGVVVGPDRIQSMRIGSDR